MENPASLIACLYVGVGPRLNSQSCWTSAPGLCCRTAGLNQLGFSRKRCSPWENHCAYSSSVENTYKDWQRIMPSTHDLPETAELHSTRPRRTNFPPLPASVSFGLKAKVTRFGAKKPNGWYLRHYLSFKQIDQSFGPSLRVDGFKPLSRSNVAGQRARGPSSFFQMTNGRKS